MIGGDHYEGRKLDWRVLTAIAIVVLFWVPIAAHVMVTWMPWLPGLAKLAVMTGGAVGLVVLIDRGLRRIRR